MKNLTIRTRLLLGFALVIVLEIIIVLYFSTILVGVNEQVKGLIGIENLQEADRDAYQSHLALLELVTRTGISNNDDVEKALATVHENHGQVKLRFGTFRDIYHESSPEFLKAVQDFETAYQEYDKVLLQMLALVERNDPMGMNFYLTDYRNSFSTMRDNINAITDITYKKAIDDNQAISDIIDNIGWFIVILLVLMIGVTLVLALVITWSISRQINLAITELSSSSQQISTASIQLARSSQEIANGAIEQASSIEETSASIEELASMVKQNASNARESSALAERTVDVSDEGYKQMENMLEAMQAISMESGRIKKIMKVIDDIAFQTNILALNAAVEAARAGDAGMGFAVVAEEVKNLANRSADAAKETADMIESSINKTTEGLSIAEKMSVQFKDVQDKARKLAIMAREVETASRQQDIGIEQVNKAIVQFDEVVQANAGSAEETASAATELQTQVESLDELVGQLTLVVLGNKAMHERVRLEKTEDRVPARPQPREKSQEKKKDGPARSEGRGISRDADGAGKGRGTGIKPAGESHKESPEEVRPETLIPFDDDEDLKEF